MISQEFLDIGFAHDRTTGKEDWLTPPEIVIPHPRKERLRFRARKYQGDAVSVVCQLAHPSLGFLSIRALGPFDLDPCSPVGRPWDTAAQHHTIHDNGLLKPWSGRVWLNPPYASALLWIKGRLCFYTREGKLDPFAGSGTTGRVAKDLGKTAVLIEREERFCEIAAQRMSQRVLGLGNDEAQPQGGKGGS